VMGAATDYLKKEAINRDTNKLIQGAKPTPIVTTNQDGIFIPNHSGQHDAGTTKTPVGNLDIANKAYVDDEVAGVDISGKLDKDGGNADVTIDIGSENLTTTGDVQATTANLAGMDISNDGTKTTFLGKSGDYNRIGDAGTTDKGLNSNDDLMITGDFEVKNSAYFRGAMRVDNTNAAQFVFDKGATLVGVLKYDFGLGQLLSTVDTDVGHQMIITHTDWRSKNHDHANQDNPTLYVQSATNPDTDNTQWTSITHDQTDGVITTGKGDLNIACPTDKTIELQETVYKDINMAGYLLTRPTSNQPDVVSFLDENGTDTTIETYGFDIGEKVHGGFELQHDYKEGSNLVFHVHWQGIAAPTGTDNVQWRLNYILMRDGTTLNAAVVIDSPDTAFDTQYETMRTDFA